MTQRKPNFTRLASLLGVTLLFATNAVWGQTQSAPWPSKPVRIVVGFPGGSTPDAAARTLAEGLSKALGQPVIVENKAGASGNIAADFVAKATDDHTLGVVINGNVTTAKLLSPQLPYDPTRDFSYLSLLTTAPLVLVGAASVPDGAAFFAAASRSGDKWSYGSVGNGSVAHLGMELLKSKLQGFSPVHIPFQGNPAVITALLGEQIQMALVPPGLAMPHVKSGKLKAIGVTSAKSALVPDVAPLADVGVSNFNLEVWTALVGSAKLSAAAQERLNREIPLILNSADARQKLMSQGWQAVGSTPEALRNRIKDETATMSGLIKAAGVKID